MTLPSTPGLDGPPPGVLARLRAAYHVLSETERRVARFVEEHPAETVRLPLKALARHIGVSEATVIRCAQSIGYAGIRDLRLALAADSAPPLQAIHEDIAPEDPPGSIVRKVLQSDIQAIADTLAVLDVGAFERTIEALLTASCIECFGIGSSQPIAQDAYYRFLRVGLPVTFVADPHMQAVSADQLPPGAVAFAISHTGRTVETLTTLKKAKASGATCILLTSHRRTPLGAVADIELVTAARETAWRTEAMESRIAHLSMIDALYVTVAMRRSDQALAALERANATIAERRVR